MGDKRESHKRSLVKAVTWRVIATLVTFLVAYLITREIAIAAGVGLVDSAIKFFAYYFHERTWERVRFGRPEEVHEDYQI